MDVHNPVDKSLSPAVGDNGHIAPLEALQVHISRGSHGTAQRPDEIRGAIGPMARSEQNLFKGADRPHIRAETARQCLMTRLAAPMHALARSFGGARERRTQHDGIGTHRQGPCPRPR